MWPDTHATESVTAGVHPEERKSTCQIAVDLLSISSLLGQMVALVLFFQQAGVGYHVTSSADSQPFFAFPLSLQPLKYFATISFKSAKQHHIHEICREIWIVQNNNLKVP
jgi:hypothetical protein